MSHYRRKRSRRQPAGCACCGTHRDMGNAAGRVKIRDLPEPEGHRPNRGRRPGRKRFRVMRRYVGEVFKTHSWFAYDREWHPYGRYWTERSAEQAIEAHVKSPWLTADYEWHVEEAA